MKRKVESQTLSISAGSPQTFDLSFLVGSGLLSGTRRYLTELGLKASYQVDTGAGETSTAPSQYSLVKTVEVFDRRMRRRRFLKGPHLRVINLRYYGGRINPDPAALIAATANQARTLRTTIPFRDPFLWRRGWDTAFAIDDLIGGMIRVNGADVSDVLSTGGTVDTIDFNNATLMAASRDDFANARDGVEVPYVDVWEFGAVQNIDDFIVPLKGRALLELILFKPADTAHGGASLSAITTYSVEALGINTINYRDALGLDALEAEWASEFRDAETDHPFSQQSALTLWSAHRDLRLHSLDALPVANDLRIRTNGLSGVTGIDYLLHVIDRKDTDDDETAYRRLGRAPADAHRQAASVSGAGLDLASWGQFKNMVATRIK